MTKQGIEQVKKGEVLFLQGTHPGYLLYLHEGTAEILLAGQEYNGLAQNIILEHSLRLGLISEKSFLSAVFGCTIRAVTDCTVQKFPVDAATGFAGFARTDPVQASNLLMHLFRRLESSFQDIAALEKFWSMLQRFEDDLALMTRELSAIELPASCEKLATTLRESFKAADGSMPGVFTSSFLSGDYSRQLGRNYAFSNVSREELFDRTTYAFFKRMLKVDRNILAHMFKADPNIPVFIFNRVTDYYKAILDRLFKVQTSLYGRMNQLFGGGDSWSNALVDRDILHDWMGSGRLSPEFLDELSEMVRKFMTHYEQLSGIDTVKIFAGAGRLQKSSQTLKQTSQPAAVAANTGDGEAGGESNVLRMYANSMQQIFEFALYTGEKQKEFLKLMNEFKKMPDPFNTDPEGRRIRRHITKIYWELYAQVFLRTKKERNVPAPVKLMLLFGFLDENLADPEQIEALHRYSLMKNATTTDVPVIFEHELLNLIYNGDDLPSVDENAEPYDKVMRAQQMSMSRKDKADAPDPEDPVTKVMFEATNMLSGAAAVCSGSRSTAFPIFNNYQIKGDPTSLLLTRQKLAEAVQEIRSADYSAFYRETVLKMGEVREVIAEEVVPYFILLPIYGTRSMTWQEIVGINKRSRGRIVIPVMFAGDVQKYVSYAVATFRWELNRTVCGAMWADPVEGGLTGAYSDYIQFFKKNSKLSQEARERIAERLKALRNNPRELFAEDYILWMTYEKNGIMKMNSYVRDLFYRFVPFRKEIREKLERMPAFAESANRFRNIRNRDFGKFDIKFRKYKDDAGNLPPEIQQYLDYLQM